MKYANLNEMIGGWFLGDFEPSIYKTNQFEVGIKEYKKGNKELKHLHKIATEITVIIRGKVKMNNKLINEGQIILLKPNEAADFVVLEDTITAVVKFPSTTNDKYFVG